MPLAPFHFLVVAIPTNKLERPSSVDRGTKLFCSGMDNYPFELSLL